MLVAIFPLVLLLSCTSKAYGVTGERIRTPRHAAATAATRQSNIRGLRSQRRQQELVNSANTVLQQPERLLLDNSIASGNDEDSDRAFDTYAFEVIGAGDEDPTAIPKLREDETLVAQAEGYSAVQVEERDVTPSAAPTKEVILETAVEGYYPPNDNQAEGQDGSSPVQAVEDTEKDDKDKDESTNIDGETDEVEEAKDDKNTGVEDDGNEENGANGNGEGNNESNELQNGDDENADESDNSNGPQDGENEADEENNESNGPQNDSNWSGGGDEDQQGQDPTEVVQEGETENSYWEVLDPGTENQGEQTEAQEPEEVEEDVAPGTEDQSQLTETQEPQEVEEGVASETDPIGEDNFVPVLDTAEYYFVDLQPFSVFVEADRDLTSDLGIPLYLLLEMNKTLETMANVHISNMTIHMGIADSEESPVNRRNLAGGEPHHHFHWNELFFHGVAELENDGVVHTQESVRSAQAGVLAYPGKLQDFWDNESGEVYQSLKVFNITRLQDSSPTEGEGSDGKLETLDPPGEEQTQQLENEEYDSKRESNVWVMVPLVILFLVVCLCLIIFAGRLRYLGSRAQERYNEKYGLDYNVYDKDISKDIFKEEYLMSEHEDDYAYNSGGAGFSDSLGSIDFLSRPINSIKATRKSSTNGRGVPVADDETPTEEEDMNGSSDDSREVFSNEDNEQNTTSTSERKSVDFVARAPVEDGSFPSVHKSQIEASLPAISPTVSPIAKGEIFHDESLGSSEGSHIDNGDTLPELRELSNLSAREQTTRVVRSGGSLVAGTIPDDEGDVVMNNSSARSMKDHSSRSLQSNNSFGSNKDGGSVMGNLSGRSNRSTRSQRSTRSSRSTGSFPSDDSFFSCQGDLV